jgi:hypothetical protein
MNFKYTPLSTYESGPFGSSSIVGGATDLTNRMFEIAQKSRNISNVKSFSKQSGNLLKKLFLIGQNF